MGWRHDDLAGMIALLQPLQPCNIRMHPQTLCAAVDLG